MKGIKYDGLEGWKQEWIKKYMILAFRSSPSVIFKLRLYSFYGWDLIKIRY